MLYYHALFYLYIDFSSKIMWLFLCNIANNHFPTTHLSLMKN